MNGYAAFLDDGADAGGLTEVKHLTGQAVADVDHGRRDDVVLGESVDHVSAGLGLELALEEVLGVLAEVGLHFGVVLVNGLFPLQQLKAQVGCAQVTGDAEQVTGAGSAAAGDAAGGGAADGRDADDEALGGAGRVPPDEVHPVVVAGGADAGVEFLQGLHREAVADGDADGDLLRAGVHGADVGEVNDDGLVAEVLQGGVGKVEVDALDEHVGADDELLRATGVDDGRVVADAEQRGGLAVGEARGQLVDEAKFPQFVYVGTLHG